MREIKFDTIVNVVETLCVDTNCNLNDDVKKSIESALKTETSTVAIDILEKLIINADIAEKKQVPICQDTGMAIVFIEIGQDVHIVDGLISDAINEGVRRGYTNGYLRKSVVADPLQRVNTKDNTPAIIHYDIVSGNKLKITLLPKGFGSENMSAVKMLNPSDGVDGVIDFVVATVNKAGSNPCPPMVVGVGIGGSFEKVCILAKKALARDVNSSNVDEFYANLESELLHKINCLGIGPQGFGGNTTALGVNIETFPTHIAGLPVAVNISCHVTRHGSFII